MDSLATIETRPERDPLPPGFRELYADHYDFLWRCALRLGAPPADVEDLIQETFVIALRRYEPEAFVGRARPSTWLFAILHNVLRNHARGERRRRTRHDRIAEISDSHSRDHAEVELGRRLLDEFLAELDADHRIVFVLAELEGLRGPEIARALGLNANTARSRLRTARQAFRARFEDERVVAEAGQLRAPELARARTLAVLAMPAGKWLTWGGVGALVGVRGLIGVGLTLAIGIGSGVVLHARRGAPDQPAPTKREGAGASAPASVAEARSREPASSEPEPIEVIAASELPRARASERVEPREDPTRAALATLARARERLAEGEAEACLALLADAKWPASLEPRKVALELGAMCSLGQVERAREHASAWQAAHPGTSTAIDLSAPCAVNTSSERGQPASTRPSGPREESK
ncbi:RNA polymerase sigma factor [Nannocystaceae bacterium ST9]